MRLSTLLLFVVSLAPGAVLAQVPVPDPNRPPPPADSVPEPLSIDLSTRIDTKLERNQNERCTAGQSLVAFTNCRGGFQPIFGVEFNILSTGTLAERFNVNLDFDSEREFDASNNISLSYQGRGNELLQRLEVGNVSFTPPPSRFITSGIPSGNYGVQAITKLGGAFIRLVAAQQKGNVRRSDVFTIGDRTLQESANRIEDSRFEGRRFFFTVDPSQLEGYPNIDILDTQGMLDRAAQLPENIRPTRLSVYRLLIGGQPENPNGPRFIPRGARNANRGPVYDYLREGVDYYADPSRLWIALLRPLGRNERLVVAYNVRIGGVETVDPSTGGTPDLEFRPEPQYANLLWDAEVTPGDPVFNREIRSAYRVGGDELDRASLDVKIVTGTSGDQEKPIAGTAETYLQMFGLAQSSNSSTLDTENRLWPRPTDPNYNIGATGGQKLIRDYFLIFPSLEPFSRRGLVTTGNPSNDTLYTTPDEDITSPRRPQPVYHLDTRYASEGVGGSGTIALQSIQLRRNSERVEIDGVQLVRDQDYTVDYDLGRITLSRPDTLYLRPRQLSIYYEEQPLFAEKPTNIFALSAEFPMENGELAFTAIGQRQSSVFSRPTLGNEAASSLIAGMSGRFAFDASGLTSALQRIMTTTTPSHIAVQGELAMSRPDANSENRAFLESFEGEGGISVPLADPRWYFSSRPIASTSLPDALTDPTRASTLVWQNTGSGTNGELIAFTIRDIDPLTRLVGGAFGSAEPLLWLSLLPLSVGGTRDASGSDIWSIAGAPSGRRWRSLRTVLSPSGVDLTRVEYLEFWALVDTALATRGANPLLVVDIGDVSENSIAFSPDTMILDRSGTVPTVTGFRGKQFQGVDVLDSERDPFTRAFDAAVNDSGLPGDLAETIRVRDAISGATFDSTDVPVCRADRTARRLGDPRINCTVRNDRLDEEDIDLDNVLNFQREGERILRFPVDLSEPDNFSRVGGCIGPSDSRNRSDVPLCWVKVRVPLSAPEANDIEEPLLRRMKTLRLTIVSSSLAPDDATIDLPIAGLRLTGAPWVKRNDAPITGIAGDPGATGGGLAGGYVIATLIGTQDATAAIPYQPPPGVIEQADNRNTGFTPGQIQINERSMRLLAGGLDVNDRAEAYYRFPEGRKSFMGYEQLRVWARGRGNGWGQAGELQFFIKIGRDADNFYLYRTPINTGDLQSAWEPEIRVDFERFFALKAKIQNALLRGTEAISSCTAADSAIILASAVPPTSTSMRYAACDGGYMVYSVDPNVNPPDLAAVQEMAVGMIRVSRGTMPVPSLLSDTLELWVDDIRLTGVVNRPGYAGHVGLDVRAADFWDMRANISRRDPDFRQLAEEPTFNTQDAVDVISTFQLGKFLPAFGLAAPLTINHRTAASNPYFMSNSDVLAEGVAGLRTPKSSATSYALTLRRSTPLDSTSRYAPLFNNLSLSSTYASTDARSEYQVGRSSNFTLGVDYNIATDPTPVRLPGWLDRAVAILPDWLLKTPPLAAFRNGEYRYAPSLFRVTSALARASDRRTSYATPAATGTDEGRRVDGLNYVWRNGTAIELRPAAALTLRWDLTSLRDLRDYGDTSAASRARERFLGQDIGLERERAMRSSIRYAPLISPWIRPTLTFGSDFTMTQDPNARSLVVTGPTTNDVLPRRMSGSQTFGAGATVDIATGLRTWLGRIPGVESLSGIFAPAEINYTRSLLSSFDRSSDIAPLSYQFGLGTISDFRSRDDELATSAGVTNSLTLANTLSLPFGLSFQNRFQRTDTRNWTRRLQNQQSVIDGSQRTFPDANLLWNWRPPTSIAPFISSVGARAGFRRTTRSTLAPAFTTTSDVDRSRDRALSYPLNLSVAWEILGGLTTQASYNVTLTKSELPGSITNGRVREYGGELSKTFAPRRAWRLPGDLRTHVGFQRSQTVSRVKSTPTASGSGDVTERRLTDNGRYSFNIGADTDVSETASFSLTGARTVTFDENFNRRFTQTVISAVLHLQFFGGGNR